MALTELNKRDWMALEQQYYQGTFKRYPITLVRGEGARVWDSEGKVYLDFVAGIAVNIVMPLRFAVYAITVVQAGIEPLRGVRCAALHHYAEHQLIIKYLCIIF